MLKLAYQIYFNYIGDLSPYIEWNGGFNPYIMLDDHGYDGDHINGIVIRYKVYVMSSTQELLNIATSIPC